MSVEGGKGMEKDGDKKWNVGYISHVWDGGGMGIYDGRGQMLLLLGKVKYCFPAPPSCTRKTITQRSKTIKFLLYTLYHFPHGMAFFLPASCLNR